MNYLLLIVYNVNNINNVFYVNSIDFIYDYNSLLFGILLFADASASTVKYGRNMTGAEKQCFFFIVQQNRAKAINLYVGKTILLSFHL